MKPTRHIFTGTIFLVATAAGLILWLAACGGSPEPPTPYPQPLATASDLMVDTTVFSNIYTAGNLDVGTDATIGDALDVGGALDVDGDIYCTNDLTVTEHITVSGNIYLTDGTWNGIQDGNIVLGADLDSGLMWETDAVNGNALLAWSTAGHIRAAVVATKSLEIETGNLAVGDGTPGTAAMDGEDAYIEGALEVDGASEFDGAVNIDGAVDMDSTLDVAGATTLQAAVTQAIDIENVGNLPTIDSAAIITTSDGAIWTVGASEIWFIYAVYCEITTNFDCDGDDCTLTIGDGNDADGFLVLTDAEMQTTDAEFTGAPAGWKGLHTDSIGAYLSGLAPFVYDGTDTIDIAIDDPGGTDPSAGAATCYVVYTRVQ